jgi:hypothetical protein
MQEEEAQKFLRENGTLWLNGANSSVEPESLPQDQFSWGINVDNKNGIVQTRDGWTPIIRAVSGKNQMLTHFRDCRNLDWLVWGTGGRLYASPYPFVQYRDLGVQLNPDSDFFTHTVVERGARRVGDVEEGTRRRQLMRPLRYLVVSDNTNKPIYWSGGLVTCEIEDAPVGQWLAFVANRLFIGGGQLKDEIWWSDIADPISFYDIGFLADGGQFRLRSDVTGLCPSPDQQNLLAFESGQTWSFAVSTPIKKEVEWKTTTGFQRVVFPDVGCVAGKSFVTHYGDLWWWSNRDLMNMRRALASLQDDELNQADQEMRRSREKFQTVWNNVTGVSHNNYLLVNTPVNEIWAKNNSPASLLNTNTPPAWLGIWTGFRVAEFTSFTSHDTGEIFTFALSRDYDNQNRIWRLFNGTQKDANSRIKCSVEFKGHPFGDVAKPKRFRWYDLNLSNIWGRVDLTGFFKGFKGGWKQNLSKVIRAAENFHNGGKVMQTRKVYSTEEFGLANSCSSCTGAESGNLNDGIDYMFQIMLQWEGQLAIDSYRLVTFAEVEQLSGRCEEDETEDTVKELCDNPEDPQYQPTYPGLITPIYQTPDTNTDCDLCPGTIPDPPRTYTSEQTCTKVCLDGFGPAVSRTATATSQVSQTDADNEALDLACAEAEAALVCSWTSTQTCVAECPPGTVGNSVTKTATYTSTISQADADAQALASACAQANAELDCQEPDGLLVVAGQVWPPSPGTSPNARGFGSQMNNGSCSDPDWEGGDATLTLYPFCVHGRPGQGGFIGGNFPTYKGVARPSLAKIDSDGNLLGFDYGPYGPSWAGEPGQGWSANLGIIDGLHWGTDGKLALVGKFQSWNGALFERPDSPFLGSFLGRARDYALVDIATGQRISTEFPGTSSGVIYKVHQAPGSSKRYIAGNWPSLKSEIGQPITAANERYRSSIARLNEDGSLDLSFIGAEEFPFPSGYTPKGPWGILGVNNNQFPEVLDINVASGGEVAVAGSFVTWGGQFCPGAAVVSSEGQLIFGFSGIISNTCTAVLCHQGNYFVAERIPSGSTRIHKFLPTGQEDPQFRSSNLTVSGPVSEMFIVNSELCLVGGGSVSAYGINTTEGLFSYTEGTALVSPVTGAINTNFRSSATWRSNAQAGGLDGTSFVKAAGVF